MLFLMMYDIHTPKRLYRIAKLMENYGKRVQYSVFEAELYPSQLKELLEKANSIIDPKTDSIKVFPFCEACAPKRRTFGRHMEWDRDMPWCVL